MIESENCRSWSLDGVVTSFNTTLDLGSLKMGLQTKPSICGMSSIQI